MCRLICKNKNTPVCEAVGGRGRGPVGELGPPEATVSLPVLRMMGMRAAGGKGGRGKGGQGREWADSGGWGSGLCDKGISNALSHALKCWMLLVSMSLPQWPCQAPKCTASVSLLCDHHQCLAMAARCSAYQPLLYPSLSYTPCGPPPCPTALTLRVRALCGLQPLEQRGLPLLPLGHGQQIVLGCCSGGGRDALQRKGRGVYES